jgi:hypothetical protein
LRQTSALIAFPVLFASLTTLLFFAGAAAAHAASAADLATDLFTWLVAHASAILATAYERAPVLVAVLAALFIVPLCALVALLAHSTGLAWRPQKLHGFRSESQPGQEPSTGLAATTSEVTPWPTAAWLAVSGEARAPLPQTSGLVRIGRHEDNDIRLAHGSVHRHHALIHRTPESEYIIVDVSGRDGNGIMINGERLMEARLIDGDTIALGDVNMRFESAPI